MKIILSRKGFDSGYGGYPSPILLNGEMLSIPIPVPEEDIKYDEIYVDKNNSYINIMNRLYGERIKVENKGSYKINELSCHLDPDIRKLTYKRHNEWVGLFGQSGAAQSHLNNRGVKEGDIFLFFGWFKSTKNELKDIEFNRSCTGFHAIYGYLQVGEIITVNQLTSKAWMNYHPHVKRGRQATDNDVVYIARESLSFNKDLQGSGTFKFSPELKLTKDGMSRYKWDLKDFMRDVNISYHSKKSWKEGYFQSATKGQEFVIDANKKVVNWVKDLIERHVIMK